GGGEWRAALSAGPDGGHTSRFHRRAGRSGRQRRHRTALSSCICRLWLPGDDAMIMFLSNNILWIKALHVISAIAWIAGMFYLTRLVVYHTGVAPGSAESERFKLMEQRLLRGIINPSMVATWVFGVTLAMLTEVYK